jgi:hypothetical protein
MISNLAVGDIDLGNYQFRFSNVNYPQLPMQPGYSYSLKLNFRRLVWAGSNIFWDDANQRLTFLSETTLPWDGQGYQGVYFMWGSLVGISPAGGDFDNSGTDLYVPSTPPLWLKQNAATGAWGTLANIPRVQSGSIVSIPWLDNHTSRNYLSEIHDTAQVNFRGDICRYLTGKSGVPDGTWRMPNAREFGPDPQGYTMDNLIQHSVTVLSDGKHDFYAPGTHSYIWKNASNTVFSAGLSRNSAGVLTNQHHTYYHSGSPAYVANSNVINASYSMFFMPPGTPPTLSFDTQLSLGYQGLVRCVKIDSGGRPFDLVDPAVDVEEWIDGGIFGRTSGETAWQGEIWY